MEFLSPAALYALLLLPLLLIPYLTKGRPRQTVFSSLLLLRNFSARATGRSWGKPRLPPIFFLQLLFLLLLALALGEPVSSVNPAYVAFVFDNSASMQAMEGPKSRFETAKDEMRILLRGLSSRARIDLYLTSPRLERVGGTDLSAREAVDVVTGLSPY
ncbi:MAG: vWA domain-containing protein, partial [Candidatus Binatia bacterium]